MTAPKFTNNFDERAYELALRVVGYEKAGDDEWNRDGIKRNTAAGIAEVGAGRFAEILDYARAEQEPK